jgi:hypothetical protein
MASFRPTRPETLADQLLYTSGWLTEVGCLDCLARVGVQKNSEQHTSIQWDAAAIAACPEMGRSPRELHAGCPRLRASIEAAVRTGRVPIGAGDGF